MVGADADGVHIVRSMQRLFVQRRWSSQKVKGLCGTPWEMMPNKTKLMELRVLSQIHHVGIDAGTRSLS